MRLFSDEAKADHFLCKMDARVKIISTLVLLVMVLTYKGTVFPLALCVMGLSACALMGIRFKSILLRFSEPLFIICVILILKVFFSGGKSLFSFGFMGFAVTAHIDGFMEGLLIGCRIMGAVTIVAVLGFTTPFNKFMAALSWMKVPRGFIEVSMFAYRYIFMLFDDAMVIYSAQKNRLGYSTIRRGLNSFGILTGSLVLKAFESSQSTAVAMTQRGYDGVMPTLDHLPVGFLEIGASAFFIILMGCLWII